jgi:hypothetical protein
MEPMQLLIIPISSYIVGREVGVLVVGIKVISEEIMKRICNGYQGREVGELDAGHKQNNKRI